MNDEKNTDEEKGLQSFMNGNRAYIDKYFFVEPSFGYIFKKIERVVSAVYLVMDIIPDPNPLKNNVQESALRLLSETLLLKDDSMSLSKIFVSIQRTILNIVSLLDVAYVSGKISEMNASVLKRELFALIDRIRLVAEEKNVSDNDINRTLHKSFFNVDDPTLNNVRTFSVDSESLPLSGSNGPNLKDAQEFKIDAFKNTQVKKSMGRPSGYIGNVAKNERRAAIFNLLREKKEITVRDLANIVNDCSEKTLQRELLQLVDEGVLQKEGERRWTRYSLVI